jgi:hypothetical protein
MAPGTGERSAPIGHLVIEARSLLRGTPRNMDAERRPRTDRLPAAASRFVLLHRCTGGYRSTTRLQDRRHDYSHDRVRRDRISKIGNVTVRTGGRLHHIGVGRTYAGTCVLLLIQDLHIRVIDAATGELLRELTLDPPRDYQPTGQPSGPKKETPRTRCKVRGVLDVLRHDRAPPAGFEPAHPPPEGGALSPELRGLQDGERVSAPGVSMDRRGHGLATPWACCRGNQPGHASLTPWRRLWDACSW